MTKYFTKTGILLIAFICFIAGIGFISSIYIWWNIKHESELNLVLKNYMDGYVKQVPDAKVITHLGKMYMVLDGKIYKIEE